VSSGRGLKEGGRKAVKVWREDKRSSACCNVDFVWRLYSHRRHGLGPAFIWVLPYPCDRTLAFLLRKWTPIRGSRWRGNVSGRPSRINTVRNETPPPSD
jgi:hypothetical protein